MHIKAHRLSELSFGKLMEVYRDTNWKTGQQLAPDGTEDMQLMTAEQEFHAFLRDCFFRTNGAVYYIWEEEGQYISALRLEPYQDGFLITGLETRPDRRRRGYAGKLLSALCEDLAAPCVLYSHIQKGNAPSLRAHSAAGFSRSAEYGQMLDGTVSARYCTMKKEF